MTEFAERISDLLEATDTADTMKARGNLLEELASHILGSIPGVKVTDHDVLNVHRSQEVDIMLFNEQLPDGLAVFEAFIYVECKNSKEPVSSAEVSYFAYKLKSRSSSLGILVARFGITGDKDDLTAAQHIISQELRDGRQIVVITEKDLAALASPEDVVDLLIRRRSSLLATCGFVQDDGWRKELPEDVEDEDVAGEPVDDPAAGEDGDGGTAIRREREQLVTEMLALAPALPDDPRDANGLLLDRSNEVSGLVGENSVASEKLEHGRATLDSILKLGGAATAFLGRNGGWEQKPVDIVSSMESCAPNIHHVQLSSSLYGDILSYYTLETLNQEDLDGRVAALALVSLMVDSHAKVEDDLYRLLGASDS